jgi:hypothetical protein
MAVSKGKFAWTTDGTPGVNICKYDSTEIVAFSPLGRQFLGWFVSFSDTGDRIVSCSSLAEPGGIKIVVWDIQPERPQQPKIWATLRKLPLAIAFPSDRVVVAVARGNARILSECGFFILFHLFQSC